MSEIQSGKYHELFGIPSSTKEYAYSPNCFGHVCRKHWDMLANDTTGQESPYIIFTGVDQQTFDQDFEKGNHYDSYMPSLRLVLVDEVIKQHKRAHRRLDAIIQRHVNKFTKGIDDGLDHTGQATRTSEDREKRPDTSYEPVCPPEGRSDHSDF